MATLDLIIKLTDNASGGLKVVTAELKQMEKATGTSARGFSSFGTAGKLAFAGMSAAVIAGGAAVAAFGKIAMQSSIEFESAFAGVVKTVNGLVDAEGNLNKEGEILRQQFRDMAKDIPVSVNALAEIGAMGGQLGIAKADLLSFTETIAKVAVATNLTEEAAATSFAQIANVMNGTQEDVERFASSVVALGNNSATTESQIVDFASRIAGAGSVAGLSMADIAGLATAFSSIGVEAEAGGTAVQDAVLKMNEAVATGNKDLAVFATTAGLSSEAFSKLWREDAAQAFTLFIEGLGRQGDNASVTLDKVGLAGARSTRAFLGLANAGPLLADSIQLANDAFEENNALNAEAEQRFKTRESQLQLLSNKFTDVAITLGDKLGPALDVLIERTNVWLDAFAEFMKTKEFDDFVNNVTKGLALVTNQMADQTNEMVKNNASMATSVGELEDEFVRLISIREEMDKIDPFANTLTQETTATIIKRLAEVSTSTEEFEEAVRGLHQTAMDAGEVGSFNVYDVLGSEQEWANYYKEIQDGASAAADEVRRLAVASAANDFELSDRELMGAGYADSRGYQLLADDLTAVGETAEETEARLKALADEAQRYESSYRSALGQSATFTAELFAAQEALTESQGEWVQASVNNAGRIEKINSQLASDLTEDQVKAYRTILDTAAEGGAEWQAAWKALQSDLTNTQRQELVAQVGDLQAAHGEMVSVYTGDAEAAEEAQARIIAAQEAIRESYRMTAFEGLMSQASLDQLPLVLQWAEQQGIIAEGEAEMRLQFAQTVAAIETTTAALANGQPVNTDYLESITLLTSGLFDNEKQASDLAGIMSSDMVQSFMDASAGGGDLVSILKDIGISIDQIPPSVTVAFVSDTSRWNPPGEGTGWSTSPNDDPTRPTAFADGGRVTGGVSGRDSVRALMMPGEYVLRESVASSIGYDTLDAINYGTSVSGGGQGGASVVFEQGAIVMDLRGAERGMENEIQRMIQKEFDRLAVQIDARSRS